MSTRLPEALSTPRDISLQASVELDSEHEVLQAQLAEAYGAALAERDREIAELSAPRRRRERRPSRADRVAGKG